MALHTYPTELRYTVDAETMALTEPALPAGRPTPSAAETARPADRLVAPLRPMDREWLGRFATALPAPCSSED